jgi:hypothetical protein
MLAMIANWRSPGTISRRSSIRLPARSAVWFVRPVALPPGRARLATRPLATGFPAIGKTIGMADVACFAAMTAGVPCVTMMSTLSLTELSHELGEAFVASLRPAILDRDITTFRPAEFAQSLHKGSNPFPLARSRALPQEADGRQLRRLLSAHRDRPRRCRAAAKQRDELAPTHGAHL